MSDNISKLGGEMGYFVPEAVETAVLGEVPTNPPNISFLPPTRTHFQSIIRKPKPQKAVGLDNLNLYLMSVLPDVFQHWVFLAKSVMTLGIPQNWLEAETFLLPKGGGPTSPSNYTPIALLTSIYKAIATHTSNYLKAHTAKPETLFAHGL